MRNEIALLFMMTVGCSNPAFAVRLVGTSPQVTEWIFQLGKGADLVAVSAMSDFPDAARSLPRLGPLFAPAIERIILFSPDWVISDGWTDSTSFDRALTAMKLAQFLVRVTSIHSLFDESLRFLKEVYHSPENSELAHFRQCIPKPIPGDHFSFLAFVWASPPILFGHSTFLSDLIVHTGGENVLPPSWTAAFPQVSEEWLIKQVFSILYFLDDGPESTATIHKLAEKLWPKKSISFIPLSTSLFARASFTPLVHSDKVRMGSRQRGCRL